MALSRKRKIIIVVAVVAVIASIVVVSMFASGKDKPEVTVVKIQRRPELRSIVLRPSKLDLFIHNLQKVAGRMGNFVIPVTR